MMCNFIEVEPIQHEVPKSHAFIVLSKCNNQKQRVKEIGNSRKKDLSQEKKTLLEIINKNQNTINEFKKDNIIDLENNYIKMEDAISSLSTIDNWEDFIVYKIKPINSMKYNNNGYSSSSRSYYHISKFKILDIFECEDIFLENESSFIVKDYIKASIDNNLKYNKNKLPKFEKLLNKHNICLEDFKNVNEQMIIYLENLFNAGLIVSSNSIYRYEDFMDVLLKFNRLEFLKKYFTELEKSNVEVRVCSTFSKDLLSINYEELKHICNKLGIQKKKILLIKKNCEDEILYKKEFYDLDEIKKYLIVEENLRFSEVEKLSISNNIEIDEEDSWIEYSINVF